MTVDIICADAREALARFPDGHFHCCVTSPPFWGLRDYGLEPTVWGGDGCEHEWGEDLPKAGQVSHGLGGSTLTGGHESWGNRDGASQGSFCRRCNAWRGTLGLEPTPELYVEHLVSVMRKVRRVLRDDGTLWLNLGDSYAGSQKGIGADGAAYGGAKQRTSAGSIGLPVMKDIPGLKPKDLVGIPWMVAEALRAPHYNGRIRDERERIWLAAMVEAEGCLFIHRRKAGTSAYSKFRRRDGETVEYKRTQDTFGAGLEVSSTDRAIVERCLSIARVGSICEQSPAANRRRKQTIYRWNVRTNECRWIVHELYPHLVAKHHEARLLIGCPSSGSDANAAHESLKALHQGGRATIDFPPPPSLFEPGWYLRSDTIWSKKNCMPESVTDRPTRSHEYLFLLTKRERYAYDADAIREACESGPSDIKKMVEGRDRIGGIHKIATDPLLKASSLTNIGRKRSVGSPSGRNRRSVWEIATQPFGLEMCGSCKAIYEPAQYRRLRGGSNPRCNHEAIEDEPCGGTTWLPHDGGAMCESCEMFYTVKQLERLPRAAKCRGCGSEEWQSHFAVFPEKLVEPCILAGCPEGGTVLDPFAGSGTVGLVAERLGRHSVLIDAKEEYCEMARLRTAQMGLMGGLTPRMDVLR